MAWNTLYMKPKSPDLGFALFADHLPDSSLKPLEIMFYLKVICTQSWGPKEPFWDLRSPKMSSQQGKESWIRIKNTLYSSIFAFIILTASASICCLSRLGSPGYGLVIATRQGQGVSAVQTCSSNKKLQAQCSIKDNIAFSSDKPNPKPLEGVQF